VEQVFAFQENAALQDAGVLAAAAQPEEEIVDFSTPATGAVKKTATKRVEFADVPASSSPIVDVLDEYGWKPVSSTA
jgi:hypothetical protein